MVDRKLILPRKREIIDPITIGKFEQIASTPNPHALHTLYVEKPDPDEFKLVTGIVAVSEENDPEYGKLRDFVYREPDVEVTRQIKARADAHYYFLVKPKHGRSILIRLTASNSLKVVQYDLERLPRYNSSARRKLEQQRDLIIKAFQEFLASYFKNQRE